MNIWIDDMRKAPKGFYHCKNYEEAISAFAICLNDGKSIDLVCFDHDLGEEKSGYDIAKYIVENSIDIKAFSIHSMNPVGRNNIRQLLTHYGYKETYI